MSNCFSTHLESATAYQQVDGKERKSEGKVLRAHFWMISCFPPPSFQQPLCPVLLPVNPPSRWLWERLLVPALLKEMLSSGTAENLSCSPISRLC